MKLYRIISLLILLIFLGIYYLNDKNLNFFTDLLVSIGYSEKCVNAEFDSVFPDNGEILLTFIIGGKKTTVRSDFSWDEIMSFIGKSDQNIVIFCSIVVAEKTELNGKVLEYRYKQCPDSVKNYY